MKKKIVLKGPLLSRSGYGEQARFALRSIRMREEEYDIFLINIRWGNTGWIWEDSEERDWIDEHIQKTVHYIEGYRKHNLPPQFDISLQVTIPQEWEKIALINIGYTAGTESTKISPQWCEKGVQHVKNKYNFENFENRWIEIMENVHEKHGSWETRKGYKSWELREVV